MNRDTDPDPPEDLHAWLGKEGILLHWDEPQWDGGSEILAYAIDWHPDPPRFPLLVSGNQRSVEIYGLEAGINYRMRVKALNIYNDSLPATDRVTLTSTLFRHRSQRPFVGSITYDRATVLENPSELPGFSVYARADSLFWGDQMVINVTRRLSKDQDDMEEESSDISYESDIFDVTATVKSHRSRFNESTDLYSLVTPLRFCITPNNHFDLSKASYSIAINVPGVPEEGLYLYDSTPIEDKGIIKICASIQDIELNSTVSFVLVTTYLPG